MALNLLNLRKSTPSNAPQVPATEGKYVAVFIGSSGGASFIIAPTEQKVPKSYKVKKSVQLQEPDKSAQDFAEFMAKMRSSDAPMGSNEELRKFIATLS